MTECARMKDLLAAFCMAAFLLSPRCGQPETPECKCPEELARRDKCNEGLWTCEADGTTRIERQ